MGANSSVCDICDRVHGQSAGTSTAARYQKPTTSDRGSSHCVSTRHVGGVLKRMASMTARMRPGRQGALIAS